MKITFFWLLPGVVSIWEEARHKDNKFYQLYHSRKDSRLHKITDQLDFLCITRDPLIVSLLDEERYQDFYNAEFSDCLLLLTYFYDLLYCYPIFCCVADLRSSVTVRLPPKTWVPLISFWVNLSDNFIFFRLQHHAKNEINIAGKPNVTPLTSWCIIFIYRKRNRMGFN